MAKKSLKQKIKMGLRFARTPIRTLGIIAGDKRDWARIVMYERCAAEVAKMAPESLEVLEISEGSDFPKQFKFKRYVGTSFPAFDICKDRLNDRFDLIIADQIFEHIPDPRAALANVRAMLKPGGTFLIATPFLMKIHEHPEDNYRWTTQGMKHFLAAGGFAPENVRVESWGNREFIRALVDHPDVFPQRGWGSLKNEYHFPVSIWAFARNG